MSSDKTVDIAQNYPVKIIPNKERIQAAAANLGIQNATGEVMAFVDADAELPQSNWLRLMIAPLLRDPLVAGSIPLLVPNKTYPAISRFFSLMQADPIIVFAYGSAKDLKDNYTSEDKYFPTGLFVIRKDLMIKAGGLKSTLKRSEDVDITYRLIKLGYKFAIVQKAGYYHLYTESFSSFLRKTYKRVSYFTESSSSNEFKYVPENAAKSKFLKNMMYDTSGIGATVRIIKGIKKDKDIAWTYYPIILLSTLLIYSIVLITNKRGSKLLKNMF